ncbi:TIGR02206 family membrane protein [Guptibacillus algicola]|uniref:YwaF family protein n=1 Tax=Guptibacillus algicola TaxID=225844 RepID=UPI001CD757AC|nr:TIGR02206 family membrane protein [Alkalihalobacillus algicola]MCA0989340.1 TIGR02206 family membrane protein [Alkalihalobacillus algicola]
MDPYLTWTINETFSLFSKPHLLVLITLFILFVLVYLFREYLRKRPYNITFRIVVILLLALSEVSFHVWFIFHSEWRIANTLPLQLSSISLFLAVILLISKNKFLFEITFFVGCSSALLAMITPELSYPFPHYRFFHFFIAHGAIVVTAWFMIVVEGYYPTYTSIWKAFVVLNLYTTLVFLINGLLDSNYMFLMEKPMSDTIYTYLGNWPWYLLSLEGIAITLFHLLYLPFVYINRNKRPV